MSSFKYDENVKKNIFAWTVIVLILYWASIIVDGILMYTSGLGSKPAIDISLFFVFTVVPNVLFLIGIYLKNEKLLLPLIVIIKIEVVLFLLCAVLSLLAVIASFGVPADATQKDTQSSTITVGVLIVLFVACLISAAISCFCAHILDKTKKYVKKGGLQKSKVQPSTLPTFYGGNNGLNGAHPVQMQQLAGLAFTHPTHSYVGFRSQ